MSEHNTGRDAGNWAQPVDRLAVANVPAGALDTVGGKQVVSPIQGFGRMWQKTYRVSLAGADVTPAELIGRRNSLTSGRRAASSTPRSPALRPARWRCCGPPSAAA
jgi:hypothetical protein